MDKVKAYYKSASGQLQPVKPYLYRPATGSGLRGVQVGDVLGVVTWADTPDKLTYSYYWQRLLTFTNGDYILASIYAETPDVEPPYSMRVELYGSSSAEFAYENDATPTSWNSPTYDFGGRTVASIDDSSIQNVIKVQDGTPAMTAPLTAYLQRPLPTPTITLNPDPQNYLEAWTFDYSTDEGTTWITFVEPFTAGVPTDVISNKIKLRFDYTPSGMPYPMSWTVTVDGEVIWSFGGTGTKTSDNFTFTSNTTIYIRGE